jgi:hypothetical protein
MISIKFTAANRSPDEQVKQEAAVKQMEALMTRLAGKDKYHTLATGDRNTLIKQGYADELVDNLVYVTQRFAKDEGITGYSDELVIGFTYSAFDPSLYASEGILAQSKHSHQGCCAYCETFLAATDSGIISHFRPPYNLEVATDNQFNTKRSPYFALAYEQHNLLYSCKACSQLHKADNFPLQGKRFPAVTIAQEQPLLVNPYVDDPRDFIRFNPSNGQAYAYDQIVAFYQATQGLNATQVEHLLWQDPYNIPRQSINYSSAKDATEVASHRPTELAYQQWRTTTGVDGKNSKGEMTIAILGLNRPGLVMSRCAMLNQLRLSFSLFDSKAAKSPNHNNNNSRIKLEHIITHQYRSLAVDAFNSWRLQLPALVDDNHHHNHSRDFEAEVEKKLPDDSKMAEHTLAPAKTHYFPSWFRSSLIYLVTQDQLDQAGKRRLVCLSASDKCYGNDMPQKCIFLAIDWQREQLNVIKVKSTRNVWETSFDELSRSREQALTQLFANNEVWVEGDYPAQT